MVAFSLYSRTVNCPSPYTVGLLPLLLDWWPSSCTAGLHPVLFVLSVGLVECGYGILLAGLLGKPGENRGWER